MSPTFLNVTDKSGILIIYVQCLSHLYQHASIEAEAFKPAILFFFYPFAFVLPYIIQLNSVNKVNYISHWIDVRRKDNVNDLF